MSKVLSYDEQIGHMIEKEKAENETTDYNRLYFMITDEPLKAEKQSLSAMFDIIAFYCEDSDTDICGEWNYPMISGWSEQSLFYLYCQYLSHNKKVNMYICETENYMVRELFGSDAEFLINIAKDKDELKMFGFTDSEDMYSQLEGYHRNIYTVRGYGMLGFFDRESGLLIGRAGVSDIPEDNFSPFPQLGYYLFKEERGKGLANEMVCAAAVLMSELFEVMPLEVTIKTDNIASIATTEYMVKYMSESFELVYRKDVDETVSRVRFLMDYGAPYTTIVI